MEDNNSRFKLVNVVSYLAGTALCSFRTSVYFLTLSRKQDGHACSYKNYLSIKFVMTEKSPESVGASSCESFCVCVCAVSAACRSLRGALPRSAAAGIESESVLR